MPGYMYPIDIDYGEDDDKYKIADNPKIKSNLPKAVQDIIKLMFDINAMKSVMKELNLDTEKMPFGKLSQKQIKSAYKVLSELSDLIQNGGRNSQFIAKTNSYYTLIPHSFGIDNGPPIDTVELIKHHFDMLDSLMEIEFAFNILKTDKEAGNEAQNKIDQ